MNLYKLLLKINKIHLLQVRRLQFQKKIQSILNLTLLQIQHYLNQQMV
nr:MAG TPA: hypothetical protein [Caudoviricetes sp.]